jgi:hypothetical protein
MLPAHPILNASVACGAGVPLFGRAGDAGLLPAHRRKRRADNSFWHPHPHIPRSDSDMVGAGTTQLSASCKARLLWPSPSQVLCPSHSQVRRRCCGDVSDKKWDGVGQIKNNSKRRGRTGIEHCRSRRMAARVVPGRGHSDLATPAKG